jgi:hypothetical protein
MKIEFIEGGTDQGPLIRIFGRDVLALKRLLEAIRDLRSGMHSHVSIHQLPGYQSLGSCALDAVLKNDDQGVVREGRSQQFRWILSSDSWNIVEGLIEGLISYENEPGHQWLAGVEARYGLEISDIGLVLSTNETGEW